MKNYSPKITAHCLACNEERWIWYAIMSVLDYVDEILVWDTGSTDKTVDIIKSIHSPKLKFREIGSVSPSSFTEARNEMLKCSDADWLLILDGDEIWTTSAISTTVNTINSSGGTYDFLINSQYSLIGDVHHFQSDLGSKYEIGPYRGQINIRAVNISAIPGIHYEKPYGQEGFFDNDHISIQKRNPFRSMLIHEKYLHATHLCRSSKSGVMQRITKYKYELGQRLPSDFDYPKCFYLPRPQIVPTPWKHRNLFFIFNAAWQSPLRVIKNYVL